MSVVEDKYWDLIFFTIGSECHRLTCGIRRRSAYMGTRGLRDLGALLAQGHTALGSFEPWLKLW